MFLRPKFICISVTSEIEGDLNHEPVTPPVFELLPFGHEGHCEHETVRARLQ